MNEITCQLEEIPLNLTEKQIIEFIRQIINLSTSDAYIIKYNEDDYLSMHLSNEDSHSFGLFTFKPTVAECTFYYLDPSIKPKYINQEKINLEWQKYLLSIKGEKYYKNLLFWYRSWIAKLESQDKSLNVNMPQNFAEYGWQEGLADRRKKSSEELSNWLEDCKKGKEIEPRIIQKINAFNNQKEIERLKANLLEIQKYYKSLNKSKFDKSAFMADLLCFNNADNTEVSC